MSRNRLIGLIVALVVLVAGLAILPYSLGRQTAFAESNAADSNTDVTFIKWVTTPGTAPALFNMEGVVSGDAGAGKYAGEVLELTSASGITTIHALYHINGAAHPFTADLRVTMDESKGTAVMRGVVSEGWMKGAEVQGEYQAIAPCGITNTINGAFGDVCFQGTLHIQPGSKR